MLRCIRRLCSDTKISACLLQIRPVFPDSIEAMIAIGMEVYFGFHQQYEENLKRTDFPIGEHKYTSWSYQQNGKTR